MKISRKIRDILEANLRKKVKVNDCIRAFLKKDPTIEELEKYILIHQKCKRKKIPDNMRYNQHVRDYWKSNIEPKSHDDCVKSWWLEQKKYCQHHFDKSERLEAGK